MNLLGLLHRGSVRLLWLTCRWLESWLNKSGGAVGVGYLFSIRDDDDSSFKLITGFVIKIVNAYQGKTDGELMLFTLLHLYLECDH